MRPPAALYCSSMIQILGSIILLCFVFSLTVGGNAQAMACYDGVTQRQAKEAWNHSLPFAEVEASLRTVEPIEVIPLQKYLESQGRQPSGYSVSYLVKFANGMKGVFKPDPNGWKPSRGEVLVYRLSQYLRFKNVPPTIIRRFDKNSGIKAVTSILGQEGSLQYFIDTEVDLLTSKQAKQSLKDVPAIEWEMADVLQFFTGQWDRYKANFLVDNQGYLVVIDNADAIMRVQWRLGEAPWLFQGKSSADFRFEAKEVFPFDEARVTADANEFERLFQTYLSPKKLKRFLTEEIPKRFPDGRVPYILWNGELWTLRASNMNVINLKSLSPEVHKALSQLNRTTLTEIVGDLVDSEKIDEMLGRLDVLKRLP